MKKLILYFTDLLLQPFDQYCLNKDKRKHDKELEYAVMRLGDSEKTKKLRQDIFDNPAKKTRIPFYRLQDSNQKTFFEMLEDTRYGMPGTPDYVNEHDRLFHAKLTVKGYREGSSELVVLEQKDIYMYQPRVLCTTNGGNKRIFVGPKFLRNGNMNSKACYCVKDATGNLLYATLPKREILSNRIFDFDTSFGETFMASAREVFGEDAELVGKFVSLEYDKDANGNMIPIPVEQEEATVARYKSDENRVNIDGVIAQLKKQIYLEKENRKALEEDIRRRESMRRVSENQVREPSAPQQSETERLNAENVRILNDRLRYGIRTPGEQGLSGPPMPPPPLGGGGPMMPPPPGEPGPILGRHL